MSLTRSKILIELKPSARSAFAKTIPDEPILSEAHEAITSANDSDRPNLILESI